VMTTAGKDDAEGLLLMEIGAEGGQGEKWITDFSARRKALPSVPFPKPRRSRLRRRGTASDFLLCSAPFYEAQRPEGNVFPTRVAPHEWGW
jgi:hypothetical protein